ncbi:uncharacterized protein LOC144108593 [Amblyomma americanum]
MGPVSFNEGREKIPPPMRPQFVPSPPMRPPAMRPSATCGRPIRPPPMSPPTMRPTTMPPPNMRPPAMWPPAIRSPAVPRPAMSPSLSAPEQAQSRAPTSPPTKKLFLSAPKQRSEPSTLVMLCVMWAMVASMASFLFVYLRLLHTKLPTFPEANITPVARLAVHVEPSHTPISGYVGDWCSASTPCLRKAKCIDGACFCDTLAFRVVAGVCVPSDRASSTHTKATDEAGTSEPIETNSSERFCV